MGSPSYSLRTSTPSGNILFQDTLSNAPSQPLAQLRQRRCLCKGCDNRFRPKSRNQKFCKQPDCQRRLIRWRNLKRQRKRRLDPAVKAKEAQAQIKRRRPRPGSENPTESSPNLTAGQQSNQATESPNSKPALSHRTRRPKDFCDRPGCYDPKVTSNANPAKYCGCACRKAVLRARRNRASAYRWPIQTVNSSASGRGRVSLLPFTRSNFHDSKTCLGTKSRSPPS